jgi:hypothetical protein
MMTEVMSVALAVAVLSLAADVTLTPALDRLRRRRLYASIAALEIGCGFVAAPVLISSAEVAAQRWRDAAMRKLSNYEGAQKWDGWTFDEHIQRYLKASEKRRIG